MTTLKQIYTQVAPDTTFAAAADNALLFPVLGFSQWKLLSISGIFQITTDDPAAIDCKLAVFILDKTNSMLFSAFCTPRITFPAVTGWIAWTAAINLPPSVDNYRAGLNNNVLNTVAGMFDEIYFTRNVGGVAESFGIINSPVPDIIIDKDAIVYVTANGDNISILGLVCKNVKIQIGVVAL